MYAQLSWFTNTLDKILKFWNREIKRSLGSDVPTHKIICLNLFIYVSRRQKVTAKFTWPDPDHLPGSRVWPNSNRPGEPKCGAGIVISRSANESLKVNASRRNWRNVFESLNSVACCWWWPTNVNVNVLSSLLVLITMRSYIPCIWLPGMCTGYLLWLPVFNKSNNTGEQFKIILFNE